MIREKVEIRPGKKGKKTFLSPPGIEPGSFAWKANIVTI
jgi:hypothetical protein